MRKQGIDESVGVLRYHIRPLTLSAMGGIPDVLRIASGKLQGVWLRDLVIYILLLWNFWALSYFK
jgi:hypothetical protein